MPFKKLKPIEESQDITAIIDKGCSFEGKLSFEGVVRIGGKFKGQVFSNDVLIISEGAFVEGEVEVDTVIVNGEFSGTIIAKKKLEAHSPAKIKGSLITQNLSIGEGVLFEGSSKMMQSETGV